MNGGARMTAPPRRASVIDPSDRLIVALDAPDPAEAERLVAELGDSVRFFKIGMELAYGGGLNGIAKRMPQDILAEAARADLRQAEGAEGESVGAQTPGRSPLAFSEMVLPSLLC